MTDLLSALLDTLLPGDGALPAASDAGLDRNELTSLAAPVLAALSANFIDLSLKERTEWLRGIEQAQPDAFRPFVTASLAAYYDAPAVLAILGWRAAPPQPQGHSVPAADTETRQRLARVQARGPIWRA